MSDTKRFYWIKLKENFLTSETVDFLMSQKDGANYVVLYQCLCLKCVNTDGELSRQIGEIIVPFEEEKIQRDLKWFSIDTIRIALELYKKLSLIYRQENGIFKITNFEKLVGVESEWAKKKRDYRKSLQNKIEDIVLNLSEPLSIPLSDKRIDIRDKRIDIRDKRLRDKEIKKKDNNKTICPELINSSVPKYEIILNDKSLFPIFEEQINQWKELYPAVDIEQEIKKMIGWCDANLQNRKTKRGIKRFINGWLSRCQDKAGNIRNNIKTVKYFNEKDGEF